MDMEPHREIYIYFDEKSSMSVTQKHGTVRNAIIRDGNMDGWRYTGMYAPHIAIYRACPMNGGTYHLLNNIHPIQKTLITVKQ